MKKHKYEASSQFRGVSYNPHAGRYEARLQHNYVQYNFGLFDDDISAAIVYDAWCEKLGLQCRSNGAAQRYAKEEPVTFASVARVCEVCNGATQIRAVRRLDGEWIDDDLIPCPSCQKQEKSGT